MHLFTALLLSSVLLPGWLMLPSFNAALPQSETSEVTHLVQKGKKVKHRGSGRREFVQVSETLIS